MATKAELLTAAQTIKNETQSKANTSVRVGGLMEDMVNQYDMGFLNYFYFDGGFVQDIATINVWVKIGAPTVLGLSRNGFTHTQNRVTNTGSNKIIEIIGLASLAAVNNDILGFGIFKNGALVEAGSQEVTMPATARPTSVTTTSYIEFNTGDFIELFVRNKSGARDITVNNINVKCLQIGS